MFKTELSYDAYRLFRDTVSRLDIYQKRAEQGEDLDAANDFARFVLNSGMCRFLTPWDNPGEFKVDSAFLRWKAEELRSTVCDMFSRGKIVPKGDQTHLEAINRKLDLIAGRLSLMPVARSESDTVALRVVDGGA